MLQLVLWRLRLGGLWYVAHIGFQWFRIIDESRWWMVRHHNGFKIWFKAQMCAIYAWRSTMSVWSKRAKYSTQLGYLGLLPFTSNLPVIPRSDRHPWNIDFSIYLCQMVSPIVALRLPIILIIFSSRGPEYRPWTSARPHSPCWMYC